MATSTIGAFEFLSLQGAADPIKEDVEPITRPGVRGVALWLTDQRGHPFRLRSVVDTADLQAARLRLLAYKALIGTVQDLVWSGLSIAGLDQAQAGVLNVTLVEMFKLANSSGGLNAPSLGVLVADWDLVLVDIPEPPEEE